MALQANMLVNTSFHKSIHKLSPLLTFKLSRRLSLATKNITIAASLQPNNASNKEDFRRLAHFPPDIWGDILASISFDNLNFESWSKEVEVLRKKVKGMLMSQIDQVEKIKLIKTLYRLGISYHYENQIEEQLSCLFVSIHEIVCNNDFDLETIAIIFQVFRLHGYHIPCDVFNKFIDNNGKFMEELANNVMGIISLYEASQFRTNGEDIMEEALTFTTKQLESLSNQPKKLKPHLQEYILNALNRPYHRGAPRVESRQYISLYEKEESSNETLLKFAKCDFNRVQLIHQRELSIFLRWSKDLNIASRLPYARNRMVEIFLWASTMYFEPHYANARNIFSKLAVVMLYLDDTYDAYGTFHELQCLTEAIQRWDIKALDDLPADYLKTFYGLILNIYDQVEKTVSNEGRSYSMSFTREEVKKIAVLYLQQEKWTYDGYMPTFDEFMDVELYSCASIFTIAQELVGMEDADAGAYEWLKHYDRSKSLQAINVMGRIYDEIVTNEDEEKRGQVACGMTCYMKQYGVSKEETIKEFRRMIEIAWKDLNEDYLGPRVVPKQILMRVINLARVIDVTYKDDDGFTRAENALKVHVKNVLLEPIPI